MEKEGTRSHSNGAERSYIDQRSTHDTQPVFNPVSPTAHSLTQVSPGATQKPFGSKRTVTRKTHGVFSQFAAKIIRPPECRCPTKIFFSVILECTVLAGLPLNLGVEVKNILLFNLSAKQGAFLFCFPGRPGIPLLSTNDFLSSSGQAVVEGANSFKTTKSTRFF